MPPLRARERAQLPDSAFAYIDSQGRRRLPIHDASHVRNALARFGQVQFEDEEARDRARSRLLRAAKRHGIMPIGFISSQLDPQRRLPKGEVTFLLTDIEGSTRVLELLGDGYAGVLRDARSLIRNAVRRNGGQTVDARADEYFAVFERPAAAIQAAIELQRTMVERSWPNGLELRVRAGVHTGRPALTDDGYVGIAVHTVARVASVAHGGQILVSGKTRTAVQGSVPPGVRLRSLGRQRLAGIAQPETLYQVNANGLADRFPPPRTR
jgi:class 3 adenylate cyclase